MREPSNTSEQLERTLIEMAVESWRFSRVFDKIVRKLDAGDAGRYANQLRYFLKKIDESLESNHLKLVSVEGQPYDAGVPASAVNIDDFADNDILIVDYMLEPIIMGPNGLRREGSVMLRKVTS